MIQNANKFELIVTMAIEVAEITCKHENYGKRLHSYVYPYKMEKPKDPGNT